MSTLFAGRYNRAVAAVGFGVRQAADTADTSVPTITSGTGAPTASTQPAGSIYLRTNGGVTTVIYVCPGGTTWTAVAVTGTDFGAGGLATDVIAESTAAAGVTIDGLRIKDTAITPAAGGAAFIDLSAVATGEADIIAKANLADALTLRTSALTYWTLQTTTATPGIAETFTRTGSGTAHAVSSSINHATNASVALAAQGIQLTTARTGGSVNAVQGACTSLAGDLNSVVYSDFMAAAPTDGGGTVVHSAFTVAAGHDRALDLTACATGEGAIAIADNLANALEVKEAANSYLKFVSTNAAEKIIAGVSLQLLSSLDFSANATGVSLVKMADNLASAWDLTEGANSYLKAVTTNSAELLVRGVPMTAGANVDLIADPGNAGAIPVTRSGVCSLTTGAADTRTLAIPTFVGQRLALVVDVDGGTVVVTSAQAINQAANTIITMADVNDFIELLAVKCAGGNLRWRVVVNDGCTLT